MSRIIDTELGRFRGVTRDGSALFLFECPVCKDWGELDEDQWQGRISVDHSGDTASPHNGGRPCTYHETHDYGVVLRAAIVARKMMGEEPFYDEPLVAEVAQLLDLAVVHQMDAEKNTSTTQEPDGR